MGYVGVRNNEGDGDGGYGRVEEKRERVIAMEQERKLCVCFSVCGGREREATTTEKIKMKLKGIKRMVKITGLNLITRDTYRVDDEHIVEFVDPCNSLATPDQVNPPPITIISFIPLFSLSLDLDITHTQTSPSFPLFLFTPSLTAILASSHPLFPQLSSYCCCCLTSP
ncbi:hypothetical protein CDL15_Pgr022341 [Punica granatum]|uniref:Uncharacterized protein n=1 Tax=Punica granatum TaxID=22663 RepID=A0A218Y4Y7_PUNGR|nr:hypothetical protein CDL15_Pgr022341 [Punica granatum]PKI54054.1 hypothetical protein CRG98_025548 [Punica granatum]